MGKREITEKAGSRLCFFDLLDDILRQIVFNEPEVRESDSRLVHLNDFTTTINASRSPVGGNLRDFLLKAYTRGMRQLLRTRQIRLACRNDITLDWANTVLRLILFGKLGDDYPCTYINQYLDFIIYTDKDIQKQPEVIL